jgi:hypothetical protein
VGAELFHVDRWTDMLKVIFTFRNFANTPKNVNVPRQTTGKFGRFQVHIIHYVPMKYILNTFSTEYFHMCV